MAAMGSWPETMWPAEIGLERAGTTRRDGIDQHPIIDDHDLEQQVWGVNTAPRLDAAV